MVSLLASVQEHASSGSKLHTKQTDAEHADDDTEEEEEDKEEDEPEGADEEPEPAVWEEVPFPVP